MQNSGSLLKIPHYKFKSVTTPKTLFILSQYYILLKSYLILLSRQIIHHSLNKHFVFNPNAFQKFLLSISAKNQKLLRFYHIPH